METLIENEHIIYWIEEDILFSEFKKSIVVDEEQCKRLIEHRHKLSNGNHQYWLLSMSLVQSYTKEAQAYADAFGQDYLHACAVLVDTHMLKYFADTYEKAKPPKIPFKIFKDKITAINWLKELKNQNEELNNIK